MTDSQTKQIKKDMFLANKTDEVRIYPIEKNIPLQISPTTWKTNIEKQYSMIEKLEIGDSFLMTGCNSKIDYELAKIRKCLKQKENKWKGLQYNPDKYKMVLTKITKPIDVLEKLLNNHSSETAHKIASNYARVWRIE